MEQSVNKRILKLASRIFQDYGFSIHYKSDDIDKWNVALSNLSYVPVLYSDSSIEYQRAYFNSDKNNSDDVSLIISKNNTVVALWPLLFSHHNSQYKVSTFGDYILPPIFTKLHSEKVEKQCTNVCISFVDEICKIFFIKAWTSREIFINHGDTGVSHWYHNILQRGAKVELKHVLFANLGLSFGEYKSALRKSYKSIVNSGAKLWQVKVMDEDDENTWNRFLQLHKKAAGRVTRNDLSWKLQHNAISKGCAILFYIDDCYDKMIGGGYFEFTQNEVTYSVGAYDRSFFDKPIGHVVQFELIKEMMKRDLQWYRLGELCYPSDVPPPDAKQLNIAKFKSGFSTHIQKEYLFTKEA